MKYSINIEVYTLPNNTKLYNIKKIYIFFIISTLIFFIDLDLIFYVAPEAILLININQEYNCSLIPRVSILII